ncbi:hypothetical protein OSB04_012712 [Centaurea solstitialis]|uniref:Integrase catalytic domain-containing protein n=1 Tax=Centaurea solstitialis TaxID=347529 RepID=A0AA38TWL6_9ASTR|nr:hypothetical protein OSB04_012712 [Centaurea solstitialis]
MTTTNQTLSNSTIRSVLEKDKLTGIIFIDWYRNLRIVLRAENKLIHLEEALPEAPPATASAMIRTAYTKRFNEQQEVAALMLVSMTPEIQKNLEELTAFEMLRELKTMFQQQVEQELFEIVKAFHACKQEDGQSVSSYVLKMKGYLDQMECLGYPCHNMGKIIAELHAMLKLAEQGLPKKAPVVLAIKEGRIQKPQGKGKGPGKGNGMRAAVEAIGSFDLILPNGLNIVLDNCHYAPTITRGIVSLSRLWGNGFIHAFTDYGISVSKDNMFHFNAIPRDGIFEIDMHNLVSNSSSMYSCSTKKSKSNTDSTYLWHCRLCHINKKRILKLQHDGLIKSIDDESFDKCLSCISRKMTRKPFSYVGERAKDLLGLIHTDVCGPFRTVSREGANYFITFTDDFSRYGYVYLLKHKHEAFETFKVFQSEVENQLGKTIKALCSDRRGEYMSQEFLDHLTKCVIVSQFTPPYTPQHNGVSERRNRTFLDMVQSMMSLTSLPLSFWGCALESATCVLNMAPTKKVDKTPYEIWHGKVPNLYYLKVWGCEDRVKRNTPNKLEPRSIKCIFVGYPKKTMGYYFYYPPENKIFVARYVKFLENYLILQEASGSTIDFDEIQSEDAQPSSNTSEHHTEAEHTDNVGDHGEPTNYKAALSDPESDKWLEAMNAKMQSMEDNRIFELVDIPPNSKTVGNKWIFKKKTDMDGNIHTYKARLVAKGYTQTYRIDYEETISPVADIKAIRIPIAIATYYDYEIYKMDVKTAFLNGHLNEDVYMVQPEGFMNPKHPNKVCKLQRSIYGLKQASRSWNKRFDEEIKKYGFTQNLDEPCVYMRASGSIVVFLILYVDDILLIMNNIPMLQDVKSWLGKCFAIKDLGEATYILGIKIYR